MNSSKNWKALQPGDSIYIIAPGKKRETHVEDLNQMCHLLENDWHLKPIFSNTIFGQGPDYYHYANSHRDRTANFIEAIESDASAVMALYGGYGSDWIVSELIQQALPSPIKSKVLVGFSDVTTLHTFVQQQWGWSSIHGFSRDSENLEQLKNLLFGVSPEATLKLIPVNALALQEQTLTTRIVGGNLTTLQSALNTPWNLSTANKTILLEEINESPYRIARMLHQLRAANYFAKSDAIIIGDLLFTSPKKTVDQWQKEMNEVIEEFCLDLPIPVFRCHGIGHGKTNHPVPLNTQALLYSGPESTMLISSGKIA